MQPIIANNKTLPGESIFHISNYLRNPFEIVRFASTCKDVLNIFTQVQENAFFKAMGGKSYFPIFTQDLCKNKEICLEKENLFAKIFSLKSMNFTWMPTRGITVRAFIRTRDGLCKFFPKCGLPVIEASIRLDLKEKCSLAELTREMAMDPNHPQIEKIKREFEIEFNELTAEKIAIDRRLWELDRPYGDGLIATASEELKGPLTSLEYIRYLVFNKLGIFKVEDSLTPEQVLNEINQALHKINDIISQHPERLKEFDFLIKIASIRVSELSTIREHHCNLCSERDQLVVKTGHKITGGRLFEVTNKLNMLSIKKETQVQDEIKFLNKLAINIMFDEHLNEDTINRLSMELYTAPGQVIKSR